MNKIDEIKRELEPLFKKARESGYLWFYTSYQDLWFSPDELEQAQAEGRFLWGASNWQLRNPYEKLNDYDKQIRDIQQAKEKFRKRIEWYEQNRRD